MLARKLVELHQASIQTGGSSIDGVVDTARMKWEHPHGFKRNVFVFPELDTINKAAYWDYQRERVYVKSSRTLMRALDRTSRPKRALAPDTTIECPRPHCCPKCNSTEMFGHGKASKTVMDIKFMRHGVKRWISRYRFHRYKCLTCGATFYPRAEMVDSQQVRYRDCGVCALPEHRTPAAAGKRCRRLRTNCSASICRSERHQHSSEPRRRNTKNATTHW